MTYILSIDEVEQLSGIDFFYNLPDNMEDDVEKEFSVRDWNINVRRK
jgi:endonuclease G